MPTKRTAGPGEGGAPSQPPTCLLPVRKGAIIMSVCYRPLALWAQVGLRRAGQRRAGCGSPAGGRQGRMQARANKHVGHGTLARQLQQCRLDGVALACRGEECVRRDAWCDALAHAWSPSPSLRPDRASGPGRRVTHCPCYPAPARTPSRPCPGTCSSRLRSTCSTRAASAGSWPAAVASKRAHSVSAARDPGWRRKVAMVAGWAADNGAGGRRCVGGKAGGPLHLWCMRAARSPASI